MPLKCINCFVLYEMETFKKAEAHISDTVKTFSHDYFPFFNRLQVQHEQLGFLMADTAAA